MNTAADHRVRRAVVADVPALAALRYEFRSRNKPPVETAADFIKRCIDWMRPHLADENQWRAWVLEQSGSIDGNIWLEIVEKLPNPNVERELHGYITNFFVRPEQRNGGAGSRLLQAALDDCRRQNVDCVFLWPSARSRPLYERHGFLPPATMLVLEDHSP